MIIVKRFQKSGVLRISQYGEGGAPMFLKGSDIFSNRTQKLSLFSVSKNENFP
jgi:hypothetical protein